MIKPPIDLGPKPKVRSREELESAMIVLRSVVSHSERYRGHRNAKVAELDAKLAEDLAVQIGESELPADVYAASIKEAIATFALKSPETLGGRTLSLASGTVGLRKNPDKIDAAEGKTVADIVEEKAQKLSDAVASLLKKAGLEGFFSLELKADLPAIKTLYAKKMISEGELQRVGFRFVPGEDRCDVKVGD